MNDREKAVERVVEAVRLRIQEHQDDCACSLCRTITKLDAIPIFPSPIAAPVPLTEESVLDAITATLKAHNDIAHETIRVHFAKIDGQLSVLKSTVDAMSSVPAPAATNPLVIEECRYCGRDIRHGLHSEKQCNNPKPAAPEPIKAACPICGRVDGPLEGHIHTSPANVIWPAAPPPVEGKKEGVTHLERWESMTTKGANFILRDDFLSAAREIASAARERALREVLSDPRANEHDLTANVVRLLLSQPPAAQGGGA